MNKEIENLIDKKLDEKINSYIFQNSIVQKIFYNNNLNSELNKIIEKKINTQRIYILQNLRDFMTHDIILSKSINDLLINYQEKCKFENKKFILNYKNDIEILTNNYLNSYLLNSNFIKNIINEIQNNVIINLNKTLNIYKYSFITLSSFNLFFIFFNYFNPLFFYFLKKK